MGIAINDCVMTGDVVRSATVSHEQPNITRVSPKDEGNTPSFGRRSVGSPTRVVSQCSQFWQASDSSS